MTSSSLRSWFSRTPATKDDGLSPEQREALRDFVVSFACGARVLLLDETTPELTLRIAEVSGAREVLIVRERGNEGTEWQSLPVPATALKETSGLFDLVIVRRAATIAAGRAALAPEGALVAMGEAAPQLHAEGARGFRLTPNDQGVLAIRIVHDEAPQIAVESNRTETRLHLGSGPAILPGWTNVDNRPYAGVNRLLDLSRGLPFENAELIFAEHFVEHLEFRDTLRLLRECRRVLRDDGVLRLTTPNLDWVWTVSYHPGLWPGDNDAIHDCFDLNRAFRGWGHKFLYNWQTLTELLHRAGFRNVVRAAHGESDIPALRRLEQHEKYPDTPELPHVLVAEASGRLDHVPHPAVQSDYEEYERDLQIS